MGTIEAPKMWWNVVVGRLSFLMVLLAGQNACHLMLVWLMMLPLTQGRFKKFQVVSRCERQRTELLVVFSWFISCFWFRGLQDECCVYAICTGILLDAIGATTLGHIPLSSTSSWNQRWPNERYVTWERSLSSVTTWTSWERTPCGMRSSISNRETGEMGNWMHIPTNLCLAPQKITSAIGKLWPKVSMSFLASRSAQWNRESPFWLTLKGKKVLESCG